jgi:7-cyano-7-deazaguanine reductase
MLGIFAHVKHHRSRPSQPAAGAGLRNYHHLSRVHVGARRPDCPDFGEIRIAYVPDTRCIELKSLKYYMIEFRNRGIFFEHVTNQILDDLVAAIEPRRMVVVGDFSVRGGIKTAVTASYQKA